MKASSSRFRALGCVAAVLGLCAVAPTAQAYPYDLYAKYKLDTGAGQPEDVTITIETSGRVLIPSDPTNAEFLGIFLKPKPDGLARSELGRLVSVSVDACEDTACTRVLASKTLSAAMLTASPPEEQLLFGPEPLGTASPLAGLSIEVHPKFSSAYLCDQERRLREAEGKVIELAAPPSAPADAKAKTDKSAKAGAVSPAPSLHATNLSVLKPLADGKPNVYAYSMLFARGLTTAVGEPILYSFCAGVHDEILWRTVAARSKANPSETDADASHAQHKGWLAARVVEAVKKDTGGQEIRLEKRNDDERANVYSRLSHTVSVLQDISDLDLYEVDASSKRPLNGLVDKNSRLVLAVKEGAHFCASVARCNTLLRSKLQTTIEFKDKKGEPITETSALTPDGNAWTVSPNLADNIGDDLTVTVSFIADNKKRLKLLSRQTRVENLGLVTTFPAVTEVVSAVNKNASNPSDIGAQSSIPLSWAVNLSHGELAHAAVTFPWMIGWNTRSAPRLSDVIKVFPGVTVIFPLEGDTTIQTTRVAFGGGIALANAFTFSGAVTVQEIPQAFFLVGISATDLAKAFVR